MWTVDRVSKAGEWVEVELMRSNGEATAYSARSARLPEHGEQFS